MITIAKPNGGKWHRVITRGKGFVMEGVRIETACCHKYICVFKLMTIPVMLSSIHKLPEPNELCHYAYLDIKALVVDLLGMVRLEYCPEGERSETPPS